MAVLVAFVEHFETAIAAIADYTATVVAPEGVATSVLRNPDALVIVASHPSSELYPVSHEQHPHSQSQMEKRVVTP